MSERDSFDGQTIFFAFAAAAAVVGYVAVVAASASGSGDGGPTDCASIGDTCADGTLYAGRDPETGRLVIAAPADAPLKMSWQTAVDYADRIEAYSHDDWRLPTISELGVLFRNNARIGGFDKADYWSSELFCGGSCVLNDTYAAYRSFRVSEHGWTDSARQLSVRLVRTGP